MKALLFRLIKSRLLVHFIGILALCTLIWYMGAHISFAGKAPLASAVNRLIAILILFVLWMGWSMIKQARSGKKNQALMNDLAAPPEDHSQAAIDTARDEEIAELGHRFEGALQTLERFRAKGRGKKQYLYEKPWYVIIGAPGCGKTTLLLNSGLNFPLSEALDRQDIAGVGGTRNCDWLFTEEAIFLDTAGRYTTQDSYAPVDAGAWLGFLDLVKKHRPLRPINGVLVTMSMGDLLGQTAEERSAHAKTIRKRLSELYEVLGTRFPLYMLFTKCDLVAGFSDYFATLKDAQRAQVWGTTFPGNESRQSDQHIAGFDSHFDGLIQGLERQSLDKLQAEHDSQRRSLILDFPHQMALLKPAIIALLKRTFGSSGLNIDFHLRGVYFTSGTQEGTPIDRVMGVLADAYQLNRQTAPAFSGRGKSFFITRLLKEVIFPEAQLAGSDLHIEQRRRRLQWVAYAALSLVTMGAITLFSLSYAHNKRAIDNIEAQIEAFQAIPPTDSPWEAGVKTVMARLDTIEKAANTYETRAWWMKLGLYRGDQLEEGIQAIRNQLLVENLLPIIKARLEQRIYAQLAQPTGRDNDPLYHLLKIYLAMGDRERQLDAKMVAEWVNLDWQQGFAREPDLQATLNHHTERLLEMRLNPVELDRALIAQVRMRLNQEPLYKQIFAHLQTEADRANLPDVVIGDLLSPAQMDLFQSTDGRDLRTISIPGLYTASGYHSFFKSKGLTSIRNAMQDNWVLANYSASKESDLTRLYDDLQKHYFDQYGKQWQNLLSSMTLKPVGGISQAIQVLDILSGSDSPLPLLLETVRQHTVLTQVPATKEKEDDKAKGLGAENPVQNLSMGQQLPNHTIILARKFADLNYLTQGNGSAPPPLNNLLMHLNTVRDYMMQISGAAKNDEAALNVARQRLTGGSSGDLLQSAQMEFRRQPEPLKGWLLSLTSSSWKYTLAGAKSELNRMWKTTVLSPYLAGLQGRYPLFGNSVHDATLMDFTQFFKPGGTVDQFFQDHLQSFVDTTPSTWRQISMDNQNLRFSANTLKQFQTAAIIRDSFFTGGGQTPQVRYEVKPLILDENVASFRLEFEGQQLSYSHGPARNETLLWPGPQPNTGVRLTFQTLDNQVFSASEEGPWAWFRTLEKAEVKRTGLGNQFLITFYVNGYSAAYELRTTSIHHPIRLTTLKNFRCSESF